MSGKYTSAVQDLQESQDVNRRRRIDQWKTSMFFLRYEPIGMPSEAFKDIVDDNLFRSKTNAS